MKATSSAIRDSAEEWVYAKARGWVRQNSPPNDHWRIDQGRTVRKPSPPILPDHTTLLQQKITREEAEEHGAGLGAAYPSFPNVRNDHREVVRLNLTQSPPGARGPFYVSYERKSRKHLKKGKKITNTIWLSLRNSFYWKCLHEPSTLKGLGLGFHCTWVEHQVYAINISKTQVPGWAYAWEEITLASWEIQRDGLIHLKTGLIEMVATRLDFYQFRTPGE